MARPLWKIKIALFFVFAVAYGVFYIYPNLYPTREPAYLPILWIDQVVPFLPWSFLIYLSNYLVVFWILFSASEAEFPPYARMMFLSLFLCGTIFMLWPTVYPRPLYPQHDNWAIGRLMALVANHDAPTNCFPSMHVANISVAVWCFRKRPWPAYLTFVLWAVAVFVSTLTTKQHYFVDIVGGFLVVGVAATVDRVLFQNRLV